MQRFYLTISRVLLDYTNAIRRAFEFAIGEDRVCLILMNNIQQSRLNLEKLYKLMGGVQLDDQSKSMLDELQRQLSNVLDQLSSMFVKSIQPTIRKCIEEVYKQLQQIKESHVGTENSSKQQKDVEARLVMEPLIDYLYQT
jgi:protein unc-13